jgi:sortase (surface protein transpeptidase)
VWAGIGALIGLQVLGIGRSDGLDAEGAATAVAAPSTTVTDEDSGPDEQREQESPVPRSATVEPPRATLQQEPRPAPPVLIRIPSIEVDAAVVPVGLEADGAMEIPSDVRTIGWYDPFGGSGLTPGEPGTAVVAGHVDSRVQGRGAFWLLRDVVPGDVVEIVHEDGTVSAWRIEEVVRYSKEDIPIADIFTFDGPARLALITCGGEFDRSIGSYLDNYVVTAVPVMSISRPSGLAAAPVPSPFE